MTKSKQSDLPARLARAQQRFDTWRRTHTKYSRLPDSLWSAAVKLAGVYGVNRTVRALRLDCHGLIKRVESTASAEAPTSNPTFVQLLGPELMAAIHRKVIICMDKEYVQFMRQAGFVVGR